MAPERRILLVGLEQGHVRPRDALGQPWAIGAYGITVVRLVDGVEVEPPVAPAGLAADGRLLQHEVAGVYARVALQAGDRHA